MPIFHHLYSKWPRIIIRLPREKMHRRDRDRVGRGGEEWRKWRHGGDIGRSVNGSVWLPVLNKNYAADYSPFRSSPHSSSSRHARVSIAVARCVRILVYLHPSISRALGSSTLPEIKRGYPTHTHTHIYLAYTRESDVPSSVYSNVNRFTQLRCDGYCVESVRKSLILSRLTEEWMIGGARPSSRIFPDHLFSPPFLIQCNLSRINGSALASLRHL